jgi:hypothetical protein
MKTTEITTVKEVKTYLPVFPGFYETIFNADEDNEIRQISDVREENNLKTEVNYDIFKFDYDSYHNDISKKCCVCIKNELSNYVSNVVFEQIISPKEYNFYNNSINVVISLSDDNINIIKKTIFNNIKEFQTYIENNFTSYDGFIPYYSNDVNEWLIEIDECLEHKTKLGVILDFICEIEKIDIYTMYDYCDEIPLSVSNYDDLTIKEYCSACKSFVNPSDFEKNVCNDCLENSKQSFETIICSCCKEIITNPHEERSFLTQLHNHNIKYSNIVCSDCEINKK